MIMANLIEIKRIPIDIEIKITRARLERNEEVRHKNDSPTAVVNPGNRTVTAQPAVVNVTPQEQQDTFEYEHSQGQAQQFAMLSYKGYAGLKEGSQIDGKVGTAAGLGTESEEQGMVNPQKIKADMASKPIESLLTHLPKKHSSNPVSWSNGKLNVEYQLDDNGEVVDWSAPFEKDWVFVPGKIEIDIKQYPRLEIEYTGGPIYFPRSADPNYVPPEE
jgi:hypothetical protein